MGSTSVPDLAPSSSSESLSISGEGIRHRNVPSAEIPEAPPIGPLLPPNIQTQTAVVRASFFRELFSSLFAFTRLMLSSPQTLVTNALNFAVTWWRSLGPELPPLQQVQDFKLSFNKKYDEITWLNCSYKSAIGSIRSNLKPIIVFLANEQKREDMDKFASMLITLKGELSDRIEFWGCDVKFS